jgi:hypothetical protein
LCAAAFAGIAGCSSTSEFTHRDAVTLVRESIGSSTVEAECMVDGVLERGLVVADFRFDEHTDPRFDRIFEEVATECLL